MRLRFAAYDARSIAGMLAAGRSQLSEFTKAVARTQRITPGGGLVPASAANRSSGMVEKLIGASK
jgi:hypothetical protein